MTTPEPKTWLRGHRAAVSSIAFLGSSIDSLISGDIEGTVLLWSLKAKRVVESFDECHPGGVLGISANKEYGYWISQGRIDGSLKIWKGEELVDVVRTESEGFCRAAIRWGESGEKYTVACSTAEESVLAVWNSEARRAQTCLRPPKDEKWGMAMDASLVEFNQTQYLIAAYEDGFLRTFDIVQAKLIDELTCCVQQDKNPATSFCLSKVSESGIIRGICGGATSDLASFGLKLGTFEVEPPRFVPAFHSTAQQSESSKTEGARLGRGTGQIALRNDERIFAIASWDHRVRIVHFRTCKHLAVLKGHRDSVQTVCFSNDSTLLASGSKDQNVAIWSVYPPDDPR